MATTILSRVKQVAQWHGRAKADVSREVEKGYSNTNSFAHLSEHEATTLRKQIESPAAAPVIWKSLFRFASRQDILIIAVSSLCAIAAGTAVPLNTVILGSLAGSFQDFSNGLPRTEFDEQVKSRTLYFVYLTIGEFVTIYFATLGFRHTGESITRKIREEYLKAVLRQNGAYFDKLGSGEVVTRITADTNVIQEGMSEKIELALSALSCFVSAYIVAFIKYWKLTLVMTSMTPVLFASMYGFTQLIVKYTKLSLAAHGQGVVVVEEALSSIRTVTSFGTQAALVKRYDSLLGRAEVFGLRAKSIMGGAVGFTICIFNLGHALASWLGSKYIVSGESDLSAVVTILLVMMLGAFALGKAAQHIQAFTNAVAAATGIYAVIDRITPWNEDSEQGLAPEHVEGRIEFRNVKHIYPSRPDVVVLQDFNLVVPAGSTIAITGASGSGKSTLIALMGRFYFPVAGEVLLDGRNIQSLNLQWLRQQIGLVSQDPSLFTGTVEANILHGLKESTTADPNLRALVEKAARLANAHEFIMQLPQGYDTYIGERGSFLSGGQRQRIAIARAVLRDPKILLFDEATSALDSKTEEVVQAALEKAAHGRTTIMIAHRLSTIKRADNIIVMGPGGKILEQGTYDALLALKGTLCHLIEAQHIARDFNETADQQHIFDEKATPESSIVQEIMAEKSPAPQNVSTRGSREQNPVAADKVEVTHAPPSRPQESRPEISLWSLIKFLTSLNRPEWKSMLIGIIASILAGAGEPIQCLILAKTLATLSLDGTQHHQIRSRMQLWSSMFVMIAVVMLACFFVLGISLAHGSERLIRRCRELAFRSILRQDIQFFDQPENTIGALTSFIGIQTTNLAGITGLALSTIFQLLATLIIGYIIALAVGWKLALVCIATVPVLLFAGFVGVWSQSEFEMYLKDAYRESASHACEAVSAARTVAAFTLEDHICRRYHDLLAAQEHRSLRFNLKSSIYYAAGQSLGFLCVALCFWYGSTLLGDGGYSLTQFYLVFFTVIYGTRSAANMFALAPNMAKAKVAAAELKAFFERTPAIDVWAKTGNILPHLEGSVEFRNVYFAYQEAEGQGMMVLNDLSFTVLPGQFVALVGASGCGKSTAIALLERFYDPSSGGIYVDGEDISTLNLEAYRKHLALVSQEPTLFQGTIRDNIVFSVDEDDISEDKILKACKEANIHDFITSLPAGFDTLVGSKGVMLSGGQKQRIAIARALLRDPKILLLDEATSALDSESERFVQAALDSASQGRTTIAVAHRLSTVRNADAIYVLDGGKIVESGTHAALMARRGRYFELARLQSLEKQNKGQVVGTVQMGQ
ncbi:ABC transporter, ABC-B family, MDR type [Pseudocercospora fijiensis CIRAD86]|uniref:ABC transporter, ABC-B family, MDR type n=1 Tax=Pseudocercospora fijiensis (strain CIRAD86) TaxID=383855 RepID=M2ZK43_PSEFD|nr:ABC transporter, ABC-B family, MDR type [Pseudocercospora fijiensis CIRAD86]EME79474.1 ABC transporter, ABC-B family, MDR type [Pseudocercospora fijiensis CIRAD86]